MASALQCPACGFKHRLSALSGEPIFSCTNCGRLLKTPAEYRRPEPSGPAEAPRPSAAGRVQRGGSATRDQTSVIPAAAGANAGSTAPRPRRPPPRPQVPLALPLRILAWVVAIGFGAYIVRYLARVVGWLTGDSLIDVITGSGIGRYLRVFALVPFWALVSTLLATLFIEGGRWWLRRRGLQPARPARPARAAKPAAKRAPKPRPRPQDAGRRQPPPTREPSEPEPAPRQPAARPPAQTPAAADTRSPSGAAGTQRARRIPRRDVTP